MTDFEYEDKNKRRKIIIALVVFFIIDWIFCGVYAYKRGLFAETSASIKKTLNEKSNGDFTGYMHELQSSLKANWHPPKSSTSARVVVFFKVLKNGNIASVEIRQYSGNADVDNAALEALYKTAPFKPLPSFYDKDSVDVEFTFDYNVFNENGRKTTD